MTARPFTPVLLLSLLGACTRPTAHVTNNAHVMSSAKLTYLGVAGWKLETRSGTLLFDPYVTRASARDELEPLFPNQGAIEAFTPAVADAVLVGHSHFDHVLDVPPIALRTGATVIGTESTANLALAGGVRESRIRVARGGDSFRIGPFHVRAVAALHSLTGQENETIPREVTLPLPPSGYAEGGTLQYLVQVDALSVFFVGTANFREDEVKKLGVRPDVAVVAVGLRAKVPDYTCRLLRALGRPPRVMPNHFDSFREPLQPNTAHDEETLADLARFADEVASCAPGTRVDVPIHLQPIEL